MPDLLDRAADAAGELSLARPFGRVSRVVGIVMESNGPTAPVGELCEVKLEDGTRRPAEVIGFREGKLVLMPIGEMQGISPGCEVYATGEPFSIGVGDHLLGRAIDGFGRPIDGGAPLAGLGARRSVYRSPPDPLSRPVIDKILPTGIRAIDGLLTVGRGQRLGIFSGSGVGKSTLLGMLARYARSDVNDIALIGERGREVKEFIERDLGPEGLARSCVVVATSDQPPLIRMRSAFTATAIAEYFRDQGKQVLLLMDSVTRFARAQREVGLAAGEPPATRGFPPSVFEMLPKFLERTGTSARGSITGLYTILVEADDMNEPIADAVRGILDGHIVLSRDIAARNQYPAIDVLESISRVMSFVTSPEQKSLAGRIRSVLAVHKDNEDLINIGAYVPGANPDIDFALKHINPVRAFLRQAVEENEPYESMLQKLRALFP
ncbi:FliI/YscN family ATPase [bacterium]|nr:FliI/YscN family ATPase [bacterium]